MGDVVHVVMVPTQQAKRIKTTLEAHLVLNRQYRISNVVVADANTHTTTKNASTNTNNNDHDTNTSGPCSLVAIPISTTTATEQDMETLVSNLIIHAMAATNRPGIHTPPPPPFDYQFGHYFCQYSSRILGNHPQHIQPADPPSRSHHPPSSLHPNVTVVQSILMRAISKFSQNHHDAPNERPPLLLYHDVTVRLQPACPPKLEWFGDDRTMVLPRNAWRYEPLEEEDTTKRDVNHNDNDDNDHTRKTLSFRALLLRYGITAAMTRRFHEDYLWTELARTCSSHRIVRRDEIHPDSPIRQGHYQILWYDPNYYCSSNDDDDTALVHPKDGKNDIIQNNNNNNNNNTAPQKLPSCHWITVTEQGIRQSFDMTKVMFSRGNISEKIRYGTLVQKDDLVLDMFAGIGYFTLPALIHGHAKHVSCCEWNPDAVIALKNNLQDNHISDRVTIYPGDCRRTIQRDHPAVLQNRFDRIGLGLLPSSEGGWSSAVLALRKDIGGWLHVHGNVPPNEVPQWSQWLSQSLHRLLLGSTITNHVNVTLDIECNVYNDWMVLVVHVEKVKSFAPHVNHYVADVFIGPRPYFPGKNEWPANLSRDCFQQWLVDHHHHHTGCIAGVIHSDRQCIELCTTTVITPPSCALSPDGPLHQTWMMDEFM